MKKSAVVGLFAVSILIAAAPLVLAQTCESHLPESAPFPIAVASRGYVVRTITDLDGVATITVGPISNKVLFDSPQNRVASVAPSSVAVFRVCDGEFPTAMGSRVEQSGAFQVRTTIQASDDALNIDEFSDSTIMNADGSCAPQCVRDEAHYVKTWRYNLKTGFYVLTEATDRDVVSRDEATGIQVERRTRETGFATGQWVVEEASVQTDPRPPASPPATSSGPWSLPFLREGCIEFSAVHAGPEGSDIGECRLNEWGTLGSMDGRMYYYALYCLVSRSGKVPCGPFHYAAEAVAIFVRDNALGEARLLLERSTNPIGGVVYHKPLLTTGSVGTYLVVGTTSPDGTRILDEYHRWDAGPHEWRKIAFNRERVLSDLAGRLPSDLLAVPIARLNSASLTLGAYLSRQGDTPADARGYANVRLAVENDEFVIRSVRIDPPPQPAEKFVLDDAGKIARVAWSPAATCFAVATETTIHVFDTAGHPLWTWDFHQTNRFIRVDALIVSPRCDAVAVGGGTDYRYVWRTDRDGSHAYIKTVGTPSSLRFDLRGDFLAISTKAFHAYVLSPDMAVRWSGPLSDLPVKWPGEIVLPAPTQSVAFGKAAVWSLFDDGWFTHNEGDDASDDGQWRVAWSAPYRGGSGTGIIEFWGPGADGYKRRFQSNAPPRWSIHMGCPNGWITRDGRFVIATGDLDHVDYPEEEIRCGEPDYPLSTYIFDRDGHIVLTWPANGNRDEWAATVLALTGEHLPAPAPESFSVNLGPAPESYDRNADFAQQWMSPDGHALLVGSAHSLRLYRPPEK